MALGAVGPRPQGLDRSARSGRATHGLSQPGMGTTRRLAVLDTTVPVANHQRQEELDAQIRHGAPAAGYRTPESAEGG